MAQRDIAQGSCSKGLVLQSEKSVHMLGLRRQCPSMPSMCLNTMPTGLFVRDLSHLHLPERGARVDQKPGSNAVLKSLERCGRREVLSLQIRIVECEPPPGDAP
jgi:hypothetical protein